jgi:hypothetical protein
VRSCCGLALSACTGFPKLTCVRAPRQTKFVDEYSRLVASYSRAAGIDVSVDQKPPRDLFVEVRVLKDLGKVRARADASTVPRGTGAP